MLKSHLLPVALTLLATACAPTEKERQAPTGDAAEAAADMGAASDAAEMTDDAYVGIDAGENTGYMIIQDTTQGVGIGEYAGADIDAVQVVCGDDVGYASGVWGVHSAQLEQAAAQRALGPAQQNDCAPEACATSIPFGKWIGLVFPFPLTDGCEVSIYEAADQANNTFEVFVCTAPQFDLDSCKGPLFSGQDGTTTIETLSL